jgi:hypothetical protein
MTVLHDPKAWTEGFKDAYAGATPRLDGQAFDALSYASGRVEGEALRLKHQQEYEQHLFNGRRVRPPQPREPGHD